MPQIPFVLDVVSERDMALALARIGVTQQVLAERLADRGDASKGLTGIGDAGSPSMNPMAIGSTPAPAFVQPNPPAPATVLAPAPHLDAMQVSTKPANYQQPNVITPPARATATVRNPMGL